MSYLYALQTTKLLFWGKCFYFTYYLHSIAYYKYIHQKKRKVRCKMLVQTQIQSQEEAENSSQSDLGEKIMEILHSYGQRGKSNGIYLHAALDCMVGFKIELKFIKSHLFVKGSFIYSNGYPISIPEVYLEMILQKLQQCLEISLRFQYMKENSSLTFQSGLKLPQDTHDPSPCIIQHIKVLIHQLPKIYQQLIIFGIVKKLNLKYSKLITKKLCLISNVIKTLKFQQSQIDSIFTNGIQTESGKKGSVFKYFEEIQQIQLKGENQSKNFKQTIFHSNNLENLKKGGYFEVQKRLCKITQSHPKENQECKSVLELAVKKLRKEQQNVAYCQSKLRKQFRILYQIENPQHSLSYWVKQNYFDSLSSTQSLSSNFRDRVYMEYVEDTLDDCIYCKESNIKDIVEYSKQVVKAVDILHKSGIVHRDLKPDNLLVQSNKFTQTKQVKIIDFGESSLKKDTFSKRSEDILGSTLPYSPIQCYISCQEGYNSCQIDLWSVGLILYQIMHKKNPITYSRCFSADIYKGWKLSDQFSIYPNLRHKTGIKIISNIFSMLAMNSVCINQKQRISLNKMESMINFLTNFLIQVQEL